MTPNFTLPVWKLMARPFLNLFREPLHICGTERTTGGCPSSHQYSCETLDPLVITLCSFSRKQKWHWLALPCYVSCQRCTGKQSNWSTVIPLLLLYLLLFCFVFKACAVSSGKGFLFCKQIVCLVSNTPDTRHNKLCLKKHLMPIRTICPWKSRRVRRLFW